MIDTKPATRAHGGGTLVVASLIAVVVHCGVLLWLAATWNRDPVAVIDAPTLGDPPADSSAVAAIAEVELWDDGQVGARVPAVDGAGDELSTGDTHPFPNADVDMPGVRRAARGGGSVGGTESVTGRVDTSSARAQMWNHPDRYRLARSKNAANASTPESIIREPAHGISDRRERALARTGEKVSSDGRLDGAGSAEPSSGVPSRDWTDADPEPMLDDPRAVARSTVGSTRSSRGSKLTEVGARATESRNRGIARDSIETAAASNERAPAPIELSVPSAGGKADRGVRGSSRQSGASRTGSGTGTAATRASVRRGKGKISVRAHRQNAYFRRLYQRVDKRLRFPKDLALALEQGTVVVRFTLHKNGSIADVSVSKSSGFKEFDHAFTRALRTAAPFGHVPASLRGAADEITVKAPYTFSNPMIR